MERAEFLSHPTGLVVWKGRAYSTGGDMERQQLEWSAIRDEPDRAIRKGGERLSTQSGRKEESFDARSENGQKSRYRSGNEGVEVEQLERPSRRITAQTPWGINLDG